jgi:hypothetical protein
MKKAFYAVLLAVILSGCDFTLLPGDKIVSLHLSDLSFIPAPVKGGRPLMRIDTEEYTGVIAWRQDNFEDAPASFSEGVRYRAEISLTPKRAYTFNGFIGTFFHRRAESAAQAVSDNSADIVLEFARLPVSDVDFISLSGTRLKTFLMVPEPSQIELPTVASLSGTGPTGTEIWYDSMNGGSYPVHSAHSVSVILPLKALFYPGRYDLTFSGNLVTRVVNDNSTRVSFAGESFSGRSRAFDLTVGQNPEYESTETEPFNCESLILPETGYAADRNYFEYHRAEINNLYLSFSNSVMRDISGVGGSYGSVDMSVSGSYSSFQTLIFRQKSRDFFLYRTISISYAPDVTVIGWQGGPLVDYFEFDGETNTLTAHLKNYADNTRGEVFYFYVFVENGSLIRKSVGIGE